MKKNYIFKKTLEEFGVSGFSDIPEMNNVLINSGEVLENDLFVAIRGGNNYIHEAAEKGAYVIYDDKTKNTAYPKAFLVNDSIKFLQKFAENWLIALKENKDRLMYSNYVDYNNFLK